VILNFFRPKPQDPSDTIYLEIVKKARQTAFYLDFSVPDTVEGRFEMILLHLALVFHRLRDEDDAAKKTAQKVVDAFFSDMDRSLREMGIGDISVPKKMKKLGQAYNGRSMAYYKAIDSDDAGAFAAAVLRNVMALDPGAETSEQHLGAETIAAYALATVTLLKQSAVAEIMAGKIATAPLGRVETSVAPALTTGETE
jgi:cytochrome b pre-mRNA-processing protein 3